MEEFTFAVAKRRLGVMLDQSEGDELMSEVSFKKYKREKKGVFQKLMNAFKL